MASTDRKFLLKLLQLEIGAHPPQAAVVALTLRAEAGAAKQGATRIVCAADAGAVAAGCDAGAIASDWWARSAWAHRCSKIGIEQVRSEWRGSRFQRSESASYRLGELAPRPKTVRVEDGARMALRRVRPARVVRVLLSPVHEIRGIPRLKIETRDTQGSVLKPVSFRDGEHAYAIAAAYGPWRTSGCWWAVDAWDTEEWDVLAAPLASCRQSQT